MLVPVEREVVGRLFNFQLKKGGRQIKEMFGKDFISTVEISFFLIFFLLIYDRESKRGNASTGKLEREKHAPR